MARLNTYISQIPVVTKAFEDIKSLLWNEDIDAIAGEAKVSPSTLYNWINDVTKNPHTKTLIKVAKALGYEIVLRKQAGKKLRAVK